MSGPSTSPEGGQSVSVKREGGGQSQGGSSGGNGNGGGNSNRNRRRQQFRRKQTNQSGSDGHSAGGPNSQTHRVKFEGTEPTLKGHVYDIPIGGGSTAAQFIATTKQLVEYVGRTQKVHTKDLRQGVINKELVDPTEP